MNDIRNRFLEKVPIIYNGSGKFLTQTTAGVDQDTYNSITRTKIGGYIYFYNPIFVRRILWDLRGGATYTLNIDSVSFGSQVVGGAGTLMADVSWEINRLFYKPTFFEWTATPNISIYYYTPSYYSSDFYIERKLYINGAYVGNTLCIPVKLIYYPIDIEWH